MIIEAPGSKPAITDALCGRTIEYVIRGDRTITLCTTCGHDIELETDQTGQIQLKSIGVRIQIKGLGLLNSQGIIK